MKLRMSAITALFSVLFLSSVTFSGTESQAGPLPRGFVYLDEVVPDLQIELRYATAHNFVGERISGYLAPRPILTQKASLALGKVQAELKRFGLGLKIFDAYRPQRAVDHFVRWGKDIKDTGMKAEFYPGVKKRTSSGMITLLTDRDTAAAVPSTSP